MFANIGKVLNCIEHDFGMQKLLVIGDLMLDRYLWGDVSRISPEAPVPVVKLARETETAGGAGNVALNAAGLGLKVTACGFIGSDHEGDRLIQIFNESNVDTSGIVVTGGPTITKTRVIGGHQQMLRVDKERRSGIGSEERSRLLDAVETELARGAAAVILSDYAKDTLDAETCRAIIASARRLGIPALVDPKGHDYSKYSGATMLSPNRHELADVSRAPIDDLDGLTDAGQRLCEELDLEFLLLTLSEQGMALIESNSALRIPAVGREVFDVSGAGDTVIATLAAGIAAGLDIRDAVRLANIAAGVVVGKVGTAPIKQRELIEEIANEQAIEQSDKVCKIDVLLDWMAKWKARGEQVVFTNGCFDLLHVGHVTYLELARQKGDRLVVGLNTDRSVRMLKGESRPVIPQDERARVLAALASVDAIVLFDEETPLEMIKQLRPDVLVKGSEYAIDDIVGAREVMSWGGRVEPIPMIEGRSTTNILKAVSAANGNVSTQG